MKSEITFDLSFFTVLALLLIALKLTGAIAWSWWLVLSPLWIPVAVAAGVFICACVVAYFSGRNDY